MPSSPGDVPVIITIHAGQVIGGSQERRRPHTPLCINAETFGMRGRKASKTSDGSAQTLIALTILGAGWRRAELLAD